MNALARLAAPLAALALTGCVATSPNWDSRFGEAARVAAAQQIISPEASSNADPVAGIDGKAAQGAMAEYAKSVGIKDGGSSSPQVEINNFSAPS